MSPFLNTAAHAVQKMNLGQAEATIENAVYAAALLFESLENAGQIRGNGHHMAQSVAAFASALLRERWIANRSEAPPTDKAQ